MLKQGCLERDFHPLILLGKTLDKYMWGLDILIGKCLYELEQK